ncbi:MAG: hypothetical protein KKE86_17000 [Planctomycetes bacterium]|nr:hypothetical protein [Planctomycetota bacterium]MCG2681305.1 hypothetical protein [Kiritimatiellia bacterium]
MNCYQLFSEWRDVRIWGDSLADAVLRHGLRTPDKMEMRDDGQTRGMRVAEHGQEVVLSRVLAEGTAPYTRGNNKPIRLVFEDTKDRIHEIDALIVETI